MAVFTPVSAQEASAFIAPLAVGKLISLRGIPSGIENTNYFITTDAGEFVLTLFERLGNAQLSFSLQLMQHLARRGIPVPEPKADGDGRIVFELNGKPACVVAKLEGRHCLEPQLQHCEQMGEALARMHQAGDDFPRELVNSRGYAWWAQAADRVASFLDSERREILFDELRFQYTLASDGSYRALPQGPIHGDLFRDNVLFADAQALGGSTDAEKLSAVFDFYFAGIDVLIFDVAVCLNDWCIDHPSEALSPAMVAAFVQAYERARPLTTMERRHLPAVLRAAALRFWLSRLMDLHFARDSALVHTHDPEHFFRVLCHHRRASSF
ncbi:homoserine kinase [Paraburkholderia sp. CNPSo 3157]|uniref:Homoserine kinase n=1 Tax=Paraburkholderia franconis TaxID=2654983 RepID=A0A7X1NKY3_9BURK|nr:homoserine kinase [Paraburkholderia franconis]MPW23840.1 homoserine kinase [Paraburkholderia franconis]